MRDATLDINNDKLVGDEGFYEVFPLERSNAMPAPVGTAGEYNLYLKIDGLEPGLAFEGIGGGPIHGSSAIIWEGELSNVAFVMNNASLRDRVGSLWDMYTYLREAGFVEATLPDTVGNMPDINLTDRFSSLRDDEYKTVFDTEQVQDALFAQPSNLSKLGVTAFLLERGDVSFHCKVVGITPSVDRSEPGGAIVRTGCEIISVNGS